MLIKKACSHRCVDIVVAMPTGGKKAKKGNFFSKGAEIRRSNDMRLRIKTYCRKEGITQVELAKRMDVSTSQMNAFMTGAYLTGSAVYIAGLSYLRMRMPISKCSAVDRANMVNNKWHVTFPPGWGDSG